MNGRGRRLTAVPRALQPALPLGHADVRWDALPRAVQDEVLAHWCELLSAAIAVDAPDGAPVALHAETSETRL